MRIGVSAHRQVDHEERQRRDQPQREQVERAFPRDALVDAGAAVRRSAACTQSRSTKRDGEERERRADGEANETISVPQPRPKMRPGGQRQHRRAGQRQPGDRDVHGEEGRSGGAADAPGTRPAPPPAALLRYSKLK